MPTVYTTFKLLVLRIYSYVVQKFNTSRGVPIIDSADISATDRAIFTILVIGTTIT